MEIKKKNNKAMYVVKGFLLFLMMGFGIEIGAASFDGPTQEEYNALKGEYQTNVEELNSFKEELSEIENEIKVTQLNIDKTKISINNEK